MISKWREATRWGFQKQDRRLVWGEWEWVLFFPSAANAGDWPFSKWVKSHLTSEKKNQGEDVCARFAWCSQKTRTT